MGISTKNLKLTGNKVISNLTGLKKHSQNIRYRIGDKVCDHQGCICIREHISITPYLNQFDGNWSRIGDDRKFQIRDVPCLNTRGKNFFVTVPAISLAENFLISFYINDSMQNKKGISSLIGGTIDESKGFVICYDNREERFIISSSEQDQYNLSKKIPAPIRDKLFKTQEYLFIQIKRAGSKISILIDGIDITNNKAIYYFGEPILKTIGQPFETYKELGVKGFHSLSVLNNGALEAFFPLQGDLKDIVRKSEGVIIKTELELEIEEETEPEIEEGASSLELDLQNKDDEEKQYFNIGEEPCLSTKEYGVVAKLIPITLDGDFTISFYVNNNSPSQGTMAQFTTIIDGFLTENEISYRRSLVSFDNTNNNIFEETLMGGIASSKKAPDALFEKNRYSAVQINRKGQKLSIFIDKKPFLESEIDNWGGDYTINAIGRVDQVGISGIHSLIITDQNSGTNEIRGSYLLQEELRDIISGSYGSIIKTTIKQIALDGSTKEISNLEAESNDENKAIFVGPVDSEHIGKEVILEKKISIYVKDTNCLSTKKTNTIITLSPIDHPLVLKGDFTISFYLNVFIPIKDPNTLEKEDLDNNLTRQYSTTIIDGELKKKGGSEETQRALLSYNESAQKFVDDSVSQNSTQQIEQPVSLYKTNKYFLVKIIRIGGQLKVFINNSCLMESNENDWMGEYKVLAIGRNDIYQQGISGIHSLKILVQSKKDQVIAFFHLQGDLINLINNKKGSVSQTAILHDEIKKTTYWLVGCLETKELINNLVDPKYFTETKLTTNICEHFCIKGWQISATKNCILEHILLTLIRCEDDEHWHYDWLDDRQKNITLYILEGGDELFINATTFGELNKSNICYSETIDLNDQYFKLADHKEFYYLDLGFKVKCNLKRDQSYCLFIGYPKHTILDKSDGENKINPFFTVTKSIVVVDGYGDNENRKIRLSTCTDLKVFTFGMVEPSLIPLPNNKTTESSLSIIEPANKDTEEVSHIFDEATEKSHWEIESLETTEMPNSQVALKYYTKSKLDRNLGENYNIEGFQISINKNCILEHFLITLNLCNYTYDTDENRLMFEPFEFKNLEHNKQMATVYICEGGAELFNNELAMEELNKLELCYSQTIDLIEAKQNNKGAWDLGFKMKCNLQMNKSYSLFFGFPETTSINYSSWEKSRNPFFTITHRITPISHDYGRVVSSMVRNKSSGIVDFTLGIAELEITPFDLKAEPLDTVEPEITSDVHNKEPKVPSSLSYIDLESDTSLFSGTIDADHKGKEVLVTSQPQSYKIKESSCFSTRENGAVAHLVPVILSDNFSISFYLNDHSPIRDPLRTDALIISGKISGIERDLLSYNNQTKAFYTNINSDIDTILTTEIPAELYNSQRYLFIEVKRSDGKLSIFINGNDLTIKNDLSEGYDCSGKYEILSIGKNGAEQAGVFGIHSLTITDLSNNDSVIKGFYPLQENLLDKVTETFGKLTLQDEVIVNNPFTGPKDLFNSELNFEKVVPYSVTNAPCLNLKDPSRITNSLAPIENVNKGQFTFICEDCQLDKLKNSSTLTTRGKGFVIVEPITLTDDFTISFYMNDSSPIDDPIRKLSSIITGTLNGKERDLLSYHNQKRAFFTETTAGDFASLTKTLPSNCFDLDSFLFVTFKRTSGKLSIFVNEFDLTCELNEEECDWSGDYTVLSIGKNSDDQAGIKEIHSLIIKEPLYDLELDKVNSNTSIKAKKFHIDMGTELGGKENSWVMVYDFCGFLAFVDKPKLMKEWQSQLCNIYLEEYIPKNMKPSVSFCVYERKGINSSYPTPYTPFSEDEKIAFSCVYSKIVEYESDCNLSFVHCVPDLLLKPDHTYLLVAKYSYCSPSCINEQQALYKYNLSDSGLFLISGAYEECCEPDLIYDSVKEGAHLATPFYFNKTIYGATNKFVLFDQEPLVIEKPSVGKWKVKAFYPLDGDIEKSPIKRDERELSRLEVDSTDLVEKIEPLSSPERKTEEKHIFSGRQSQDCYYRNRGSFDSILSNKSAEDPYISLENIFATSELDDKCYAKSVFDLTCNPIGEAANNSWRSKGKEAQRLCVKISRGPCTVKGIKYINYHDNGMNTEMGVKNIEIYAVTGNLVPSANYDAIVETYDLLFSGELIEHLRENVADWQPIKFSDTNKKYEYLIFNCKDNHGNDETLGLRSIRIVHHNEQLWGDNGSSLGTVSQSNKGSFYK